MSKIRRYEKPTKQMNDGRAPKVSRRPMTFFCGESRTGIDKIALSLRI